MAILVKLIYKLNLFPIKISADTLMEMEKCDPKIHIKIQETQNNQNNLENNKFF